MKAAIYARKSNDDDDRNDDNKSVTRQVDRAKAYAESKGWAVDDAHVYVDDGISGAEYVERHGLIKLQSSLGEFDVIVTSEISRIGRDMYRNAIVIDDIISSGKRIFYYLSDKEEKAETPEQRLMVTLNSFAAEMERAKTSERTRDALERKIQQGHSAGGRCYGYDLVPVYSENKLGESVKSFTDFKINDDEAEVLRGIFRMYVDGYGHGSIAKALNGDSKLEAERVQYFSGRTPEPPSTGSKSWAPTSIREMLYRRRYIGVIEYGKTKKVRAKGCANKRAKGDRVITTERHDLRIIDDLLWQRVQNRLEAVHDAYVKKNLFGVNERPETGRESKYLLSGLMRCGCCGGNMVVVGGQRGRHYYYGCCYLQKRGSTVCSNSHRIRMGDLDGAVISAIKEQVLTPAALAYLVDKVEKLVREKATKQPDAVDGLLTEQRKIKSELQRFMKLIAAGEVPETILSEIREREARLKQIDQALERSQLSLRFIERYLNRVPEMVKARMEDMGALIHSDVARARKALRALLSDEQGNFQPIQIKPTTYNSMNAVEFFGVIGLKGLLYKDGAEERT